MTPQQIINDVARYYGITSDQLIHGDRHRKFSDPRHVAAYCLRVNLRMSYATIGSMLGGKCHATIMYSVNKVSGWMSLPRLNPAAIHGDTTSPSTPTDASRSAHVWRVRSICIPAT